jgi:hypothetical protein
MRPSLQCASAFSVIGGKSRNASQPIPVRAARGDQALDDAGVFTTEFGAAEIQFLRPHRKQL